MTDRSNPPVAGYARPALLARWLWIVAALVVLIVLVGGITRLTESGLSITEWKPVSGVVPPLNEADWQEEFRKYQQIPEYQQINRGMSLDDFKTIFFWEWVHRQLGRLIGMAMVVPLLWFAWRRAIPAGFGGRLIAITALVGFQGAIGWWMVASGLETRTDVSHLRLATHLLTALTILAALVWTALDLTREARQAGAVRARVTPLATLAVAMMFVQLLLGAWTAGLNAGQVASTWPDMNGYFVPQGIDWSHGVGFALTHDPFLSHFLHRWWAWAVAAVLVVLARRSIRTAGGWTGWALMALVAAQMLLGITTVLSGVLIDLAVLHQVTGALLVAVTMACAHAIGCAGRGSRNAQG